MKDDILEILHKDDCPYWSSNDDKTAVANALATYLAKELKHLIAIELSEKWLNEYSSVLKEISELREKVAKK